MIKEAIVKIVNKEDLTYDEAYTVMNEIMSGETTATQNAAFLAAFLALSFVLSLRFLSAFYCFDNQSLSFWSSSKSFSEKRLV